MRFLLFVAISFCFVTALNAQQPATITMWKDSAIGAIYNKATESVAYGKPNKKGTYHIYISDTLGNNEKPLTYPGWQADRHQWAEEWDPTGQYLFCYVEKNEYAKEKGHKRIPDDAVPGYGGYTDLWLIKRDGSQAWKLIDMPNDYSHGVCHGALSEDGTMFTWTERIKAPKFLDMNLMAGAYVFKVADVTYGDTPTLTNIRTFKPGYELAGGEVESISPDKTTIAFYSTFESKNLFATPSYTLNINTGKITKLTTESFSQCPTFTPDGKHIVYMTGQDCDIFPFQVQGADWWIMNPDGTNKQRLTFMNKKDHAQSINKYRLAGSLSFISNNNFFGGVMARPLGLFGYTVKVKY
jgi:Tol biopolymer transport system component